MNQFFFESATAGLLLSLAAYEFGRYLKDKTKSELCNPLLISIIVVILFLLLFQVDYENYNASAKILNYFLTPATVSLAIPLYQKLQVLKEHLKEILFSILAGVLANLTSVLGMSILFGMSHSEYVTLLPKSITTAIGMDVSDELGGNVTITVAVIIVTGILGNIIAESICKWFRIKHPISVGLAIGTSAHAAGTAKAMELGKVEGAMSSLAIVVAGLCTVVGASVFAMFY